MNQAVPSARGASSDDEVSAALTALARQDAGRVIGLLARRFGDLDLADEAVAEALARATERWPLEGVPDQPTAWLTTVARRIAIDRLRRADSARRRTLEAGPDLVEQDEASDFGGESLIAEDGEYDDAQLRLILLCCHPALDRDTQVALTLRLVGGLTTSEVAAALLVPEATMAQRIVRAKKKIRAAAIPMSLPADLGERLGAVLTVLYLVFNEGYLTHSDGPTIRTELTDEAIRLTATVAELAPEHAETHGLLALELFLESRRSTRIDGAGDLVLLEDQDRSRWDRALIDLGNGALHRAMALRSPGRFQVEANIAGLHANARSPRDTDWNLISALYAQLEAMTGSPVVALNRVVAIAMVDGPEAGLERLAQLTELDRYHLRWATEAELLVRSGRAGEAALAFDTALSLATSDAERRHLERRIADVSS